MKVVRACLILAIAFSGIAFAWEVPEHPVGDKSEYRRFRLENGLKVLMVSNPEFNKSAAALDVLAGSMDDPSDKQGLAHYHEHMLFLGTEKYPEPDEFMNYLRTRGGYANAYTAGSHTNYQMEVHHWAFQPALDRFSRFFIDPIFNPDFSEREKMAVQQEYEKNRMDDNWRSRQVLVSHYAKGHPERHFSIGNLETLGNVKPSDLNRFREETYSADRMALVLMSTAGLDEMEQWVREYFSQVPGRNLPEREWPPGFIKKSESFRLIRVRTIKDIRELNLIFELPSLTRHYRSKPGELLGFIVGHEGEGSLLAGLKEQGLATALSAGAYESTTDYGTFHVNIELTEKGYEQVHQVLEACYGYFKLLRQSSFPEQIYSEISKKAKFDYAFTARGEGQAMASRYATQINQTGLKEVEKIGVIYEGIDSKVWESFVSRLIPENALTMLEAMDVPVEMEEPYFGAMYSYSTDSGEVMSFLKSAEPQEWMSLPRENPFLPDELPIRENYPVKITDEPGLEIWHSRDIEFDRPRVFLDFEMRYPKSRVNLEQVMLRSLYFQCVREQLNEINYPASMAGIHFSFGSGLESANITLHGYDRGVEKLYRTAVEKVNAITLSEERFEAIKEKMLRNIRNFDMQAAWVISRQASNRMHKEVEYPMKDKLEALEKINLQQVRGLAGSAFRGTSLRAVAHGNYKAEDVVEMARDLSEKLGTGKAPKKILGMSLPGEKLFRQGYLSFDRPGKWVYREKLKTDNSCFRRNYFLGRDNPANIAFSMVTENLLKPRFYSEMRTKRKLGYLVWSAAYSDRLNRYYTFIVQSGTHTAKDLRDNADEVLPQIIEEIRQLPEELFEEAKQAAIHQLREKDKTIHSRGLRYRAILFEEDGDFEKREKIIHELEKLDLKSLVEQAEKLFLSDEVASITLLHFAFHHPMPPGETEGEVKEIESFKKRMRYLRP